MKWVYYSFLLPLLLSCDSQLELKNNAVFLHGNASKLWLIDKMMVEDRNYVPIQFAYRELMVFHQNSSVYFYQLKSFGEKRGEKATYYYDPELKVLEILAPKVALKFKIKSMSRSNITLKPIDCDYPYTLHLIPFPEY